MSSSSSNTTATVPGARHNNLIAESDLTVALAALQQHLQAKAEGAASVTEQQLLQDCARSLSAKLAQTVQPLDDEAFHVYLARYKDDMLTCPTDDGAAAPGDKAVASANATDDTVMFEEEELVDQAAAARVQELREQVRAQAATIQTLRASVLDRSVAVAERQLKLWMGGGTDPPRPENSKDSNSDAILEEYKSELEDMKASMQSMSDVLQETGTALPAKLQSFQSTLQEIETSLNKQQDQPLSQIEQAIYHRENVAANANETVGQEEEDTTEEFQKLPPAQRLANLLCRD